MFINSLRWSSVIQTILAARLVYLIIRWQPQLYSWVNNVRAGSYASIFWCAVLFIVSAFQLGECARAVMNRPHHK